MKDCEHKLEFIENQPFFRAYCLTCKMQTGWFDTKSACERAFERGWVHKKDNK